MQSIAEENNLSETAFFVPGDSGYHIRWFTPVAEVKLCGHATLAAAFVIFNHLNYTSNTIEFDSLSGRLTVTRKGEYIALDFPLQIPQVCDVPADLLKGLGLQPVDCLENEDYIVVLDSEKQLAQLIPDYDCFKRLPHRGVIATAASNQYDFVVRFFAPKYGIAEDPVTGSAYTQLMPYWSKKFNKTTLKARQISYRGGDVYCELAGDRVIISGQAVKYLEGTISI